MRSKLHLGVAVLALAATGCGGDDGGVSAGPVLVVPTPVPVPPPPPPPPPPPATNATLKTLTVSQTFPGLGASLAVGSVNQQKAPGRTISAIQPGTATVAYDAQSQSYTITFGDRTAVYGNAQLQQGSSADPTLLRYQQGPNDILLLKRSLGFVSASQSFIELSYVGYGRWGVGTADPFREVEFVYGIATAPSDLPASGTYTFHPGGFALIADDEQVTFQNEEYHDITADFAAGTVHVRLTGISAAFPIVEGDGTIDRTRGTFTVNLSLGGYSGTVEGRFFGPKAAEVGATFTMRNAAGGAHIGAMAGPHN
jgi:hypothetical protein